MRINLGTKKSGFDGYWLSRDTSREREQKKKVYRFLLFLGRHWPLFQTKTVNGYHEYFTLGYYSSMIFYYRTKKKFDRSIMGSKLWGLIQDLEHGSSLSSLDLTAWTEKSYFQEYGAYEFTASSTFFLYAIRLGHSMGLFQLWFCYFFPRFFTHFLIHISIVTTPLLCSYFMQTKCFFFSSINCIITYKKKKKN